MLKFLFFPTKAVSGFFVSYRFMNCENGLLLHRGGVCPAVRGWLTTHGSLLGGKARRADTVGVR